MKRTWTIIGVSDVLSSGKWYQSLFGQPETPPAHDYFDQILDTDATVLLCLHQWGAHGHPSLMSPAQVTPGNRLRHGRRRDRALHQPRRWTDMGRRTGGPALL